MGSIYFEHELVGELVIDNGIDLANWSYNVNTAHYPTYGGEVIQILSVFIDDLTVGGTLATYKQAEAIFSYFADYFQVATQGVNPVPVGVDSTTGSAYNLQPVHFYYPERQWHFKLYPMSAPAFRYGREVVTPTWQVICHVIDDSPDLDLIKNGITALATTTIVNGDGGNLNTDFTLNGNISPEFGDPNHDPFETYNQSKVATANVIQNYADYYNSLLPAYNSGNFESLTGIVASTPNFGQTTDTVNSNSASSSTPVQTGSTQARAKARQEASIIRAHARIP